TVGMFYQVLGIFHSPLVATSATVVIVALSARYLHRAMTRVLRERMTDTVMDLPDRAHADEMFDWATIVQQRRLTPDGRRQLALNMARAAMARSVASDSPDGLVAATDQLRAVLADPPKDWQLSFQAAEDLVAAMSVKANKHGDLTGWDEAMDLLVSLADEP